MLPKARDPGSTGTPPSPGREGGGCLSHHRRAPSVGWSRCLDGHSECQGQERGRKRGAWERPCSSSQGEKRLLLWARKMASTHQHFSCSQDDWQPQLQPSFGTRRNGGLGPAYHLPPQLQAEPELSCCIPHPTPRISIALGNDGAASLAACPQLGPAAARTRRCSWLQVWAGGWAPKAEHPRELGKKLPPPPASSSSSQWDQPPPGCFLNSVHLPACRVPHPIQAAEVAASREGRWLLGGFVLWHPNTGCQGFRGKGWGA